MASFAPGSWVTAVELQVALPGKYRVAPPTFLVVFASPFLVPGTTNGGSIGQMSVRREVTVFLSKCLLMVCFSCPLLSAGFLLGSGVSSVVTVDFFEVRCGLARGWGAVALLEWVFVKYRLFCRPSERE